MELLGRPIDESTTEARLDALVRRNAQAGNSVMNVLNLIGGQAEGLLDRLPPATRMRLNSATEEALRHAAEAAHRSREVVGDGPHLGWLPLHMAVARRAPAEVSGKWLAQVDSPSATWCSFWMA